MKDLTKEKEATLFEMFDYLCSKIDWDKTSVDLVSVDCMSKLFKELRKDERKISLD